MAKSLQFGLGAFQNQNVKELSDIERRLGILESQMFSLKVSSVNANGIITGEILGKNAIQIGLNLVIAYPLFSNIKTYPLINETVIVFKSISNTYQTSPLSDRYYYTSPTNIWNEPESNPLPLPQENVNAPTQNKTYLEVEAGSSNKPQETSPETFKPGTYFVDTGNIKPLYSFEGDTILEGRFGNTIRLGSTNTNSPIKSPWSNLSQFNSNPITIIDNTRNNTSLESFSNDSSIWLTSTQKLPITGSSTDYTSYEVAPTSLDQYSGRPQIVINSGRLVFNSTLDHILLSSKQSINLNSVSSVNVDTNNFVVQSAKVYLGDSEDSLTQPIVLGDDLVSLLTDILTDLNSLTRSLQNQVGVPVGTPLAPTSLTAQLVADKIPTYKRRVSQLLSNTTRTAV